MTYTPHFSGLLESLDQDADRWLQCYNEALAEDHVLEPWMTGSDLSVTNPIARSLKKLLIIKIIRPDRLGASIRQFVRQVCGDEISDLGNMDLMHFVTNNVKAKSPLLMVSAPGYDASTKVDMLAKQGNKKYTSVAIGSPEAFGLVDQAIRLAAKSGSWVLLKNVHLAPAWLVELEKKIYNMNMDKDFRLFLTMENNPKVPTTLLRASHVMVFEPPSGIKAAMERSYT